MFSFIKKKEKGLELKAYLSGKTIGIEEVKDDVFSSKMMGDGIAIIPTTDLVKAPADGKIVVVMKESKHAVGIKFENGVEALIHVGIDTVSMKGEGFELFVEEGDNVKEGDSLIKFDLELIKQRGFATDTMLIITDNAGKDNTKLITGNTVAAGRDVVAAF